MRTIKTLQCIRALKRSKVLPDPYVRYLEEEFRGLMDAFRLHEPEEEFSLDRHGYLVVLEKGDNLRDLSSVGLDRKAGGLFGCIPEFVSAEAVGGDRIFKVSVLYNNDYMMQFYLPESHFEDDKEVMEWLTGNLDHPLISANLCQ